MERLKGRVAFVTGAAGGIGLAISEALIEQGASVVLADIDQPELEHVVSRLGNAAAAYPLDVTNLQGWAEGKLFAEARFGPVDILVNNAGIGPDGHTLADMDPVAFDRVVKIKLYGTFNGISTFGDAMRARGDGHIVNTASMAGLIANARLGAYTASKFAIVGLSEVLRAEMAPHGVGVSVLCPGLVQTRLAETTKAAGSDRVDLPRSAAQAGISPAVVGLCVIEGIRNNAMHILTHGEYRELVELRMKRVLSAFDDVVSSSAGTNLPGPDVTAIEERSGT